ncbi:MAG: alanine racemase [Rhodomicrobium sp.]|nr:MAG: alanine racemase [Rhodomicrobium sp.]
MAGAILTINLSRLVENWRFFNEACRASPDDAVGSPLTEVAAVVKADAYGLGAIEVGKALWAAGCRRFFVAHGSEGAALRETLAEAEIFVFHGALLGEEESFKSARLIPVLNSEEAALRWAEFADKSGYRPAAIQVDTGMNRLGFSANEFNRFIQADAFLDQVDLKLIMSHLAVADDHGSPQNEQQRLLFERLVSQLPEGLKSVPCSLANSAGVLLGAGYHYDIARVGIGLYGGNPFTGVPNPMKAVVKLEAEILQRREIEAGEAVSYGGVWQAERRSQIATIGVGYADGYLRLGGEQGFVMIGGKAAPIVGRVTMDLIMIDVTDIEERLSRPGCFVELLNDELTVDDVAAWSGTIGYEVLTALGGRYERRYIDS